MQLAGELAKMNLASLIRLVRNGELSGKVCLTQGVNTAFIFFEGGQPVHVESDYGTGRDALLELFLWQSGTFSYIECSVEDCPRSLSRDESLEKLLKEGTQFQEAVRYLEQLRIGPRTVFRAAAVNPEDPLLSLMDAKTSLADLVQTLGLSRADYILHLQNLVAGGKALVVEAPAKADSLQLPDWVISRLKQDNPDVSQAIVDLVIWSDRIKCWLYQADVDLTRVISAMEDSALSEAAPAEGQFGELSSQTFLPEESYGMGELAPLPGPSDVASNEPLDEPASQGSESPAPQRGVARPPSYEF